ncbi:predicted protein [Histoplasma capsulatum H143]|uniref:Uncharacterized protein n=1 Tax=Ajellomyces capsulatus (strain H143) TaxID=544712 RepID=C6HSN0_AJECH|nr:predicted protein [Histoplasma capsulatum H143]
MAVLGDSRYRRHRRLLFVKTFNHDQGEPQHHAHPCNTPGCYFARTERGPWVEWRAPLHWHIAPESLSFGMCDGFWDIDWEGGLGLKASCLANMLMPFITQASVTLRRFHGCAMQVQASGHLFKQRR